MKTVSESILTSYKMLFQAKGIDHTEVNTHTHRACVIFKVFIGVIFQIVVFSVAKPCSKESRSKHKGY